MPNLLAYVQPGWPIGYALSVDELDRAVDKRKRTKKADDEARMDLHAKIRKVLTERASERGIQSEVARRTGYSRERLRQIMLEADA